MSRVQLTVTVGAAAFLVSLGVWWLVGGGIDRVALVASTVTALVATVVAHRSTPSGGLHGETGHHRHHTE